MAKKPMDIFYVLFISIVLFTTFAKISSADDSITLSQSLTDGKFLVSKEGSFKLGFFNPGTSKSRYVGIWYNNIGVTVVWVANRCNPINGYSGVLKITNTGNLVLLSQKERVAWSPPSSSRVAVNPVLQLLDSGNLVLRDDNSEEFLWQSFDYPSDTLLPGMKLGWDLRTGLSRHLSSWKNSDDPCPGNWSFGLVHGPYPEAILREGSRKIFRSGPWDGITFSGAADLRKNCIFNFSFISTSNEVYYSYQLKNKSTLSRLFLNQSNSFQRDVWNEATKTWNNYLSVPEDKCDKYSSCGPYGVCNTTASPACQCVYGFKPKLPNKWEALDWSNGCVRIKPLNFSARDGFLKFRTLKLPDTTYTWVDKSTNLKKCKAKCMSNYSCMAYTNSDISGKGSGCVMWFGELIDIRHVDEGGQDLYIRMSASVVAKHTVARMMKLVAILAASSVFFGILIIAYYYIWRRKNKKDHINDGHEEDLEVLFFNLARIAAATDNFSINNKLGEGGFGPVYKGKLVDGKEMAVKRLSRSSGQGLTEFKNEITLISKLQHRNLVKLLGCCLEGEEKLLIYEYVPNKSLDYFIFDQARGKLLCWSKRIHIICGVARGLLYLHQDSRLRIIHRDLKASNILIDNQMNPKISDFGMAKTFGGDQTEGSTNRLVGTYGYMAPEYAIDGLFSVKSDVFSFGILLLEIVSGKRNRGFNHSSLCRNLIGHAWVLWKEGRPLELFDEFLLEPDAPSEALRCIQVGLLCVQQHPEDRPSMSTVVVMLTSETSLSQPKQPGFFIDNNQPDADPSSSKLESYSINGLTITQLEGR